MAKRKRLTPAQPGFLDAAEGGAPSLRAAPGPLPPAPIAQVAGEASASAALSEVSAVLTSARAEGRLIENLPLQAIDTSYLVRDRLVQDVDDMVALMASIEARGQQTPIEVVLLDAPRKGCTHGLISGWRRLTALSQLREVHRGPDGDRFGVNKARVIAPDSRQAA